MTIAQIRMSPRRVLLVEDNLVNQRVAFGLLTRRGHRVTLAGNGVAALAALERDRFDVVLMDIQMPEMDGLEATARIREREQTTGEHMYIIAMTAHAMYGDREHFLKKGMDAYLPKPLDHQALFNILESDVSAGVTAPPAAPSAPTLDVAGMRDRLGDDDELIADVIGLFLEDYPARLDAIQSAMIAHDEATIRREAHVLKGSAGTLSAAATAEAANQLEMAGSAGDHSAIGARFAQLVAETERLGAALRRLQEERSSCES